MMRECQNSISFCICKLLGPVKRMTFRVIIFFTVTRSEAVAVLNSFQLVQLGVAEQKIIRRKKKNNKNQKDRIVYA